MFKINEIVQATGGLLLNGSPAAKVRGISTDSRSLKPDEAFLALRGERFDGHDFITQALKSKVSCIIVEKKPAVPVPEDLAVIKVKDTTLALGDIARYQRLKIGVPVIAVTGSNGKTTTKEMVAWVLSGAAKVLKNEGTKNNQIGLPQTLIQLTGQHKFAVVEIGTNHFGEIDYLSKIASANIGIITNIGPSHLEFLKDLKGVFKEKTSLLDNLASPGLVFLNADDPAFNTLINGRSRRRIFTYGINRKSDFCASGVKLSKGKVFFRVNSKFDFELSSLGDYNVYNALAAIGVGRIMGISYAKMSARLADFEFPKGRLKPVRVEGLNFIDDTYNSNPLSLRAALQALGALPCAGKKIVIMGDMLELGEQKELLHRQIAWSITNSCDYLIAVGALARLTAQEAVKIGWPRQRVFCCADAPAARKLLRKRLGASACDLILVKGSRSMKMEEVLGI